MNKRDFILNLIQGLQFILQCVLHILSSTKFTLIPTTYLDWSNAKQVEIRCRHVEHLAIKGFRKKQKSRINSSCPMGRVLLVFGFDKRVVYI